MAVDLRRSLYGHNDVGLQRGVALLQLYELILR
jgi:hypothetical protein